jgi:hypothetical protein
MVRSPRHCPAAVLLFCWCAPVIAQGDGSAPIVEYGVGLAATVLVLLFVCWPAKRK